ncbi:MAG: hypothetical protein Hals2KO_07950 [Halioglobus sp.]
MLKLIYLAQRKPGFSFDEFVRRWRMHGATGMAQPLWRHTLSYVQSEPIFPAAIPGATEDYDAVATFTVRDSLFSDMTEEDVAGASIMAEDELETFSEPIANVSLWVNEKPIKAGPIGGYCAYLFFPEISAARATAEQAKEASNLIRVTLNTADEAMGDGNTLPYGAIIELSAASIPALSDSVSHLVPAADLTVVTRNAVLWDTLD